MNQGGIIPSRGEMKSRLLEERVSALESKVAELSTSTNISSDEICKDIMEVLLSETGILTHCNISRRREIKELIKSVIDCKLSHLL